MTSCWKCGKALTAFDYGRGDICSGCRNDTRVCRNCIHYEKTQHNECRETQADRVVEKERSNFCDYFKPGSPKASGDPAAAAKAAAEAFFKKK